MHSSIPFFRSHIHGHRTRLAKEPQFKPGISTRSFELVDKFVTSLNVPGRHVAVSADDTKLLATFRPFLDRETHEWYIVGGCGEPLLVSNIEELHEELDRAGLQKATKVSAGVSHPCILLHSAFKGSHLGGLDSYAKSPASRNCCARNRGGCHGQDIE